MAAFVVIYFGTSCVRGPFISHRREATAATPVAYPSTPIPAAQQHIVEPLGHAWPDSYDHERTIGPLGPAGSGKPSNFVS